MSEIINLSHPALAMPATTPMPRVNELLCFSLYATANAMNRVYQPLLEELGLTYAQFLVLVALWEEDSQPVGRIGSRLGLESNTLTPLLKRMEAASLITRSRSAEDERQVIVSLAPKGRSLRKQAAHIPGCILDATGMKEADAVALRDELMALRQHLMEKLEADS